MEAVGIVVLAGYTFLGLTAIPNEYSRSGASWWEVSTDMGIIKIGWRKRVINIDWSHTGQVLDLGAGERVCFSEGITHEPTYVHAWSEDAAINYLRELRKYLSPACQNRRVINGVVYHPLQG